MVLDKNLSFSLEKPENTKKKPLKTESDAGSADDTSGFKSIITEKINGVSKNDTTLNAAELKAEIKDNIKVAAVPDDLKIEAEFTEDQSLTIVAVNVANDGGEIMKPSNLIVEDISTAKDEPDEPVFKADPMAGIKKASAEAIVDGKREKLKEDQGGGISEVVIVPFIEPERVALQTNVISSSPSSAFVSNTQSNAIASAFGVQSAFKPSISNEKSREPEIKSVAAPNKVMQNPMNLSDKSVIENPIVNPKSNPLTGAESFDIRESDSKGSKTPIEFFKSLIANLTNQNEVQKSDVSAITTNPAVLVAPAAVEQSNKITSYLGTEKWGKEVAQKIIWMVAGTDKSATLSLNPPDLGPLQVVISINNDKADTQFRSDNPEVRLALEKNIDVLRDMMKGNAVELGQTDIRDSSNKSNQDSSFTGNGNPKQQQSAKEAAQQVSELDKVSSVTKRPTEGIINTFA